MFTKSFEKTAGIMTGLGKAVGYMSRGARAIGSSAKSSLQGAARDFKTGYRSAMPTTQTGTLLKSIKPSAASFGPKAAKALRQKASGVVSKKAF